MPLEGAIKGTLLTGLLKSSTNTQLAAKNALTSATIKFVKICVGSRWAIKFPHIRKRTYHRITNGVTVVGLLWKRMETVRGGKSNHSAIRRRLHKAFAASEG